MNSLLSRQSVKDRGPLFGQAYGATELTRWFSQGSHDVTVRVSLNDKVWSEPTSATIDAVVVSDISPVRVPVGETVTFSATTSPSGHGALVNWNSKKRTANYTTTYKTEGTYTLQTAIKAGGATGPPETFEVEALPLKKPKNLDPSAELEEFIRGEESVETELYNDDGVEDKDKSEGNCTIGIGHLVHFGPCGTKPKNDEYQKYKDGITKEQAEDLFDTDVKEEGANPVQEAIDVKLTQYQFDALTSFSFNLGPTKFKRSDLVKKINKGLEPDKIVEEIKKYNTDGGKVVSGLTTRRNREAKLYSEGAYP